MHDATAPPDPATAPPDSGRALLFPPLVAAGIFSAPGPALDVVRWLLVAAAALVAWAAAKALVRAAGEPAGRPGWRRHSAAGVALALAPLVGYAAAHPDLAQPWGAAWLAAFALTWGTALDVRHAVRAAAAAPARPRALDAAAWLLRAAELSLVPAIARIMESVGQPLPTLPAAAAFAVWIAVVGLLQREQKRAEEARPAFRGADAAVAATVLALVLLVRALSRGGL